MNGRWPLHYPVALASFARWSWRTGAVSCWPHGGEKIAGVVGTTTGPGGWCADRQRYLLWAGAGVNAGVPSFAAAWDACRIWT